VALRAAADDPRLLSLVPRRLAERARKLGNQRFLLADSRGATSLLSLAARLNPFNAREWLSLIVAKWFARPAYWLMGPRLHARRIALGGVAER
jgi:hypothetical protein